MNFHVSEVYTALHFRVQEALHGELLHGDYTGTPFIHQVRLPQTLLHVLQPPDIHVILVFVLPTKLDNLLQQLLHNFDLFLRLSSLHEPLKLQYLQGGVRGGRRFKNLK